MLKTYMLYHSWMSLIFQQNAFWLMVVFSFVIRKFFFSYLKNTPCFLWKFQKIPRCEHLLKHTSEIITVNSFPRCFCFTYADIQIILILFTQNGMILYHIVTFLLICLFQSLDYDRCINDPYLEVLETMDNKVSPLLISWSYDSIFFCSECSGEYPYPLAF